MLTEKDISIVIATRNRVSLLLDTLGKLGELHPDVPVIVVDNGSTDGTPGAVRKAFPAVEVVELGRNAGTGARTIGVQRARTPLVAFNDDDSYPAGDCLARAAGLFNRHPRLGLAATRVLVGKDHRLDPVCTAMKESPLTALYAPDELPGAGKPILGFLCCGCIVRKQAFLEVSGFEERYGIGGEEQLLAMDLAAAGWQVCYFDELVAHHHPQPSGDRKNRVLVMDRNGLWSHWMRRPVNVAWRRTVQMWRQSPETRKAVLAAFRGLPWVLRKRKVVPLRVEQALRVLEGA